MPAAPPNHSDRRISEIVDEGGKLAKEIAALERKKTRVDAIKQELRELAGGKDTTFTGKMFSATVENKPDTIARVVAEEDLPFAIAKAGSHLAELFSLHPRKGDEANFEMNALKRLSKSAAQALVARFTVPATPWVRFR